MIEIAQGTQTAFRFVLPTRQQLSRSSVLGYAEANPAQMLASMRVSFVLLLASLVTVSIVPKPNAVLALVLLIQFGHLIWKFLFIWKKIPQNGSTRISITENRRFKLDMYLHLTSVLYAMVNLGRYDFDRSTVWFSIAGLIAVAFLGVSVLNSFRAKSFS
jgi:hypothetical protein